MRTEEKSARQTAMEKKVQPLVERAVRAFLAHEGSVREAYHQLPMNTATQIAIEKGEEDNPGFVADLLLHGALCIIERTGLSSAEAATRLIEGLEEYRKNVRGRN